MQSKCRKLFSVLISATIFAAAGCQTTRSALEKPSDPDKIAQAKETLKEIPTINDEVAETFYQQGLYFEEKGLAEEAIREYVKAIKVKPSFEYLVTTQLGMLYRQTGQVELAKSALSSAVTLHPDSALAHYQLGLVCLDKGDCANAVIALQKSVALNPDLADAQYRLGKTLWSSDRSAAAPHLRRYLKCVKNGAKAKEVNGMLKQLSSRAPVPRATARKTLPPQRAPLLPWDAKAFRRPSEARNFQPSVP